MLTHPKSTVRAILDNFKVWLPVFPERIKRSTTGKKLNWPPSLPRWRKNGELWPSNKKVTGADVDLLNSTMRILRMLMYFNSGHVILLPWVFWLSNFLPNRTYGAGRPYVGLCLIFLICFVLEYATKRRRFTGHIMWLPPKRLGSQTRPKNEDPKMAGGRLSVQRGHGKTHWNKIWRWWA